LADDLEVSVRIAELIPLANGLFASGKLDEAENIFNTLNNISPGNFEILRALGLIAATRGAYRPAAALMAAAIAVNGDDALAHNVLSVCRFQLGDHAAALQSAERAVALRPAFTEAHNNRGNALNALKRNEEAAAAFQAALAYNPRDAVALVNLGNALRDLERFEEALAVVDQAIAINGNIPAAHRNRGNVLHDLGRHEEALEAFDQALRLDPRFCDAHGSKGNVLVFLNRHAEAVEYYKAALAIDDGRRQLLGNLSHSTLLLGRYLEGWRLYESRWEENGGVAPSRNFPMPLWLGEEDLQDRSILLHCEQGLGDAIHFVRYVTAVSELGATVWLEAPKALMALFEGMPGVLGIIARGDAIPTVDFHCPLMSLPLALWAQPASPSATPPYLHAPPDPVEAWDKRLAGDALRIGLVCSGNPEHTNDHNRSIPLEALLRHLPAGPAYYVVQKPLREADLAALPTRPDVRYLGDEIESFIDTAAICACLDLVISVDTSVAHLAGALARPLWVLLPFVPEWRWLLDTEECHWYPTARLYRQSVRNDWSGPLDRVGRDIASMMTVGPGGRR
jgi:tetratricopeptide (TPR) repeat protein